jgi:hypothetical protein
MNGNKSSGHSKEKSQNGSIVCIKEENYLQELMLNSKRIKRTEDFFSDLG